MMVEKDEWIPYKELELDCPNNNRFNVDTRDFHAGYLWDDKPHPDINKLKKYNRFFYTKEEVMSILDRLYLESGGEKGWRFLSLSDYGKHWELKYIRIFRISDNEFLICDSDYRALNNDIINSEVVKEYL
jgi:hypothetical protein